MSMRRGEEGGYDLAVCVVGIGHTGLGLLYAAEITEKSPNAYVAAIVDSSESNAARAANFLSLCNFLSVPEKTLQTAGAYGMSRKPPVAVHTDLDTAMQSVTAGHHARRAWVVSLDDEDSAAWVIDRISSLGEPVLWVTLGLEKTRNGMEAVEAPPTFRYNNCDLLPQSLRDLECKLGSQGPRRGLVVISNPLLFDGAMQALVNYTLSWPAKPSVPSREGRLDGSEVASPPVLVSMSRLRPPRACDGHLGMVQNTEGSAGDEHAVSHAGRGSSLKPFRGALAVDLQVACRLLGAACADPDDHETAGAAAELASSRSRLGSMDGTGPGDVRQAPGLNPASRGMQSKPAQMCTQPLVQQAQCSICVSRLHPNGETACAGTNLAGSASRPPAERLAPVAGVAVVQAKLSTRNPCPPGHRGPPPRSGVVSLSLSLQVAPEPPAVGMNRVDIVGDRCASSADIGAGFGADWQQPPARLHGERVSSEGIPGKVAESSGSAFGYSVGPGPQVRHGRELGARAAESLVAGARAQLEWLVGMPWAGGLEVALTRELDHFCCLARGTARTILACTLSEALEVERCLNALAAPSRADVSRPGHQGDEPAGVGAGEWAGDDGGQQETGHAGQEDGDGSSTDEGPDDDGPSGSQSVESEDDDQGGEDDRGQAGAVDGELGSRLGHTGVNTPSFPRKGTSMGIRGQDGDSGSGQRADAGSALARPPLYGGEQGRAKMVSFSQATDGSIRQELSSPWGSWWEGSLPSSDADHRHGVDASDAGKETRGQPAPRAVVGDPGMLSNLDGSSLVVPAGHGINRRDIAGKRKAKKKGMRGAERGKRASVGATDASKYVGGAVSMGYSWRVKYPPNTAMGARPSPDKSSKNKLGIHHPHGLAGASIVPPPGQAADSGLGDGWVFDDEGEGSDRHEWAPAPPSWPVRGQGWHSPDHPGTIPHTVTVIVHRPAPQEKRPGSSPAPVRFTIDPVAAAEAAAGAAPGGSGGQGGRDTRARGPPSPSHVDTFVAVVVAMASATKARGAIKGVFDMQGREKVSLDEFVQGEHVVLLQAGESLDKNLFPFYEGTSSASEGEGEGSDSQAAMEAGDDGGDPREGMRRWGSNPVMGYQRGHATARVPTARAGGSRKRREDRERAFLDRLSRPKPALVHSVVFVHLAGGRSSSRPAPSSTSSSSLLSISSSALGVPVSITSSVETLPQLYARVERALEVGMPVTRLYELRASKRGTGRLARGRPIRAIADTHDGMHLIAYTLASQLDASRASGASRGARPSFPLDDVTGTLDHTGAHSRKPRGSIYGDSAANINGSEDGPSWVYDISAQGKAAFKPPRAGRRMRRCSQGAAFASSNVDSNGNAAMSAAERDASFLARMSAPSPHHTSLNIRVFRGVDASRWGIPDNDSSTVLASAPGGSNASLSYLPSTPGHEPVSYRTLSPTYPAGPAHLGIAGPAVPRSRMRDIQQRQQGTLVRVPASVGTLPELYDRIQRGVRPPLLNPVREVCSVEGYPIESPADLENGQDVVYMCQGDPPFVPGTLRARRRRSSVGGAENVRPTREWGVKGRALSPTEGRTKAAMRPFLASPAGRARAFGSGLAMARSLDSCSFEQGLQLAKDAAEAASIVASQMFAGSLSLDRTPQRAQRVH